MRNLGWLVTIILVVAVAAALNRPWSESKPPAKVSKGRKKHYPVVDPMLKPPVGFHYTGPLLGKWSAIICTTPFGEIYRADGIVEYQWIFGETSSYGTYEVDDTHCPPVLIITEQKDGRLVKDYCIWEITSEGKLRTETFKPGGPIPTRFSKDPNPLLLSRAH